MKKTFIVLFIFTIAVCRVKAQQLSQPDRMQMSPPPPSKEKMEERFNKMKKELNLTPDQEKKMRDLMDKKRAERKAELQKIQEEIKKNRQEMKGEMEKILTPEQMEKMKKIRKEELKEKKDQREH